MGVDRRLLISLSLVFALLAAACGSTVPVAQQEAVELGQGIASDDLSGGIPEGATVNSKGQVVSAEGEVLGDAEDFGLSSGGGGVAVGGSSGGTSGTGDGTSGTGGTGGTGGSGGSAASGANGPGITADAIKVGVAYADDAEEANAAIGAAGATQINTRRAWEAMLNYVNKSGGAAGRKLVPVFHRLSATSTEPYDQQDQEVCAHWAQDDPVFVADGGFKTENGISCMIKNGMVVMTTNGLRFKSGDFYTRYPLYMEYDGIDNDAIDIMYAEHMKKMGFFDEGYKLGIVSWEDPEYAIPTRETLVPKLRQLGIKVSDVTYITYADSGGEAGNGIAQVGNTAVRYKGEGITHVMFQDLGGNLAFFFAQAAQRQQYAPRYGLTTASGNTAVADLLSSGSAQDARDQLKDALSIGWLPSIDTRPDFTPAWAETNAKEICYKQMREGGVEMDSGNARALAESVCDSVWTIKATLDAAGPVINQQTWYRGLAKVGSLNLTGGGTGFRVSPERRDALEYAARMKFFSDCVCFKYVSDRFRVPE